MKHLFSYSTCLAAITVLIATHHAQASVTLNSDNFPDANFRTAVANAAGVSVGNSFNEANLTTLDLPSQSVTSVTNLKGLELLTGLTYLDISGNPSLTTGADLTGLTALRTLKASNCNISTLANTHSTNSNHPGAGLTIGSGCNVIYLDLSHNANFYYSGNLQYMTKMETLLLNNCTNYDYWATTAGNGMTSLIWLDISQTACDRIYLPMSTKLKHLNAAGTRLKGFNSSASYSGTTPTQFYIQLPVNLTALKYLNLANCPSLNSFRAINEHYKIASLDTLILTNNTDLGWSNLGIEPQTGLRYLDVTNCDISTAGPNYIPDFSNLTALETLLYGENPNVGYLRLTGCSALTTLDLHNNTGLTMLALDNCGLPRTNLTINDSNCPAFTGLKLNNNGYSSVAHAMNNATAWGLDNIKFLYLENNSGFTHGPLTLGEGDCAGLIGLDLSNNGFTSFSAPSLPSSLTALMLGKSQTMTRLEMHNNPGITTMTADTVMSDGSGLYLLGNTALTYMDISGTAEQPNYFQRIGNNGSLNGVPIDTIKASYNKFYTFRNLSNVAGDNYERWDKSTTQYDNIVSSTPPSLNDYYYAYWPAPPAQPDSASLEQLTGLRYLDLSHCQLKDSLYLHKNVELRYLDVSHNRSIARYTTSHDKGAAYRASIPTNNTFNRDFPDYKKYLWLTTNHDDREYFTGDYNDTTGLYILDLMDNDKLEYLNISYTGIEQTALTHCHVSNARYIWIQDLNNLKYFYADYNGMRSMGIGTLYGKKNREGLKSLERLSVIGMRGTDDRTMQGSINFRANSVCKKLHYVNLSYSRFDSIGVYAPQIDTLIVKGNPLHYVNVQTVDSITFIDATECAYKTRGYVAETGNIFYPDASRYKNGARIGGTYNGAITTELSGLRGIRAYNRSKLTTVKLDNSNALREVYCHHDPNLPKIHGFENLSFNKPYDAEYHFPTQDADSLRLVWVNDNPVFNELNLSQNVKLNYLHAYNDPRLGEALGDDGLLLTTNDTLITAWVSNSNIRAFSNCAGANLDTLKIWTNPLLAELNVSENTGLEWLDLRNCRVSELDINNCNVLSHFDCSNDSVPGIRDNGFGYMIPDAVPNYVGEPGKNSISDLHFAGTSLRHVKADNNDLYCMDGLSNNPHLDTLTYAYNHINAIDLSGTNISIYDNTHNGRGRFYGEMARWKEKHGSDTITYSMYYLQLKPNAGDGLHGNDTFLGNRCGQDTLRSMADRSLLTDGFIPDMVDQFTVNAGGPYNGTRVPKQNAPRRTVSSENYNSGTIPTDTLFYGTIAVLDLMSNSGNYIEYSYKDGRTPTSTSTFYIVWLPTDEPTEVEETLDDNLGQATVVEERFYDVNGIELSEPVKGVTIIVRQMSDGTTQTVKVLK